jgi:hypothetical protein
VSVVVLYLAWAAAALLSAIAIGAWIGIVLAVASQVFQYWTGGR